MTINVYIIKMKLGFCNKMVIFAVFSATTAFKKIMTMNKLPLYWNESRRFLKTLANLSNDTDIDATINSIEKGVEFKGANVWILFFAIIIASVGLNVNSTAVIIGAMLVSPLMGPINGIGLAVGVNDSALYKEENELYMRGVVCG